MQNTDSPETNALTTPDASSAGIKADAPRPTWREAKRKRFRRRIIERVRQAGGATKSLKNVLTDVLKSLAATDAEARKLSNRDIATFFQYYDGREYGDFNDAGEWEMFVDDEIAYSMLLVPSQVDAAKTVLLKTRLEYEFAAKSEDSTLDAQLAEMCDALATEEMERILTDDLRSDEILFLLCAGKSYREHYFARNPLHTQTAEIPEYKIEKVALPNGGEASKFSHSTASIDLPENQMRIPNPLAVQHDLSKKDVRFSFLIERDLISRTEAEYLYSQTFSTQTEQTIDDSLRLMRELEQQRVKAGVTGSDDAVLSKIFAAGAGGFLQRTRCWLPVHFYANIPILENGWYFTDEDGLIYCPAEEDVPGNARKIRYGTFIADVLPKGMYVCFIGEDAVEINKGRVADRWLKIVLGKRPANGDGAGLKRLRSLADMKNDLNNLGMKVLMDDADPKTFIDRAMASNLAPVGSFHLLDVKGDGKTIRDAAMRMQGAAAHPALESKSQEIDGVAQMSAGTFSSIGNGAADVMGKTATAVMQMAENSAGRFIEPVTQIAAADIESRYIVLQNIQENSLPVQRKKLVERFGTARVNRFFEANLRQTIKIGVKKGTDQPKSQTVMMAKMQAFGQVAAQLGDNLQATGILADFSNAMDLPASVGTGLTDRAEAERRIGLLREWAKPFNEANLPDTEVLMKAVGLVGKLIDYTEKEIDVADEALQMILAMGANAQPPIEQPQPPVPMTPVEKSVPSVIMMQEHTHFMDVYKDWLYGSGANISNKVLQFAVGLNFKLHYERNIIKNEELAMIEARKQGKIQKFARELQASMAPPPPSPEEIAEVEAKQKAAEDAATEKEILMEAGKAVLTDEQKEKDFERLERGKNNDLERDAIRNEHQAAAQSENEADEEAE